MSQSTAIADLARTLYESPKMFGGNVPAEVSSERIAEACGRTFWANVPVEIKDELLAALALELDFLRFEADPLGFQFLP